MSIVTKALSGYLCLCLFSLLSSSGYAQTTAETTICPSTMSAGNLRYGVAAQDNATGSGWLMWSETSVHNRFSPSPHPDNADHFIAVKHVNGQWMVDHNNGLSPFTPAPTDCLIADVNFSAGTVNLLQSSSGRINGIDSGFSNSDLYVEPNRWNGNRNRGEFYLTGSYLSDAGPAPTNCPSNMAAGNLRYGVAAQDNATGSGWLMWSETSVHNRFSSNPHPDNAEHFIAVKYVNGQWMVDHNNGLSPFTPAPTDCLIADVNFSAGTVNLLQSSSGRINGIDSGFSNSDLHIEPNHWNGKRNRGEFYLIVSNPYDETLNSFLDQYELVFNDEFNSNSLDPEKWDTALLWGPYLPINNEEQLYVDSLGMHDGYIYSPFSFTGNTLKITATAVSTNLPPPPRPAPNSPLWHPNPYSEYNQNRESGDPTDEDYDPGYQQENVNYLSGIITSYGSFKMTHGYVEMRAKVPGGKGLWPAFWLLPTHYVKDVPEIDVMEFLGQHSDRVYHTYHYFDVPNNWAKISTPSYATLGEDWTESFHTYGMAWTPTEIIWYVDGVETKRINDSDYTIANQAMYLIANLAVGGSWPGTPNENTVFPAEFEIDYIRAYKKKTSAELNLAEDYQLMFQDEFNGSALDPNKWNTHFLWGPYLPINNEEQYYVDSLGSDAGGETPFRVSNGVLSITARRSDDPDAFKIPQSLPSVNDDIWSEFPTFYFNSDYSPPSHTSGIITSYDSFKFGHGYVEMRAKIPKGDGLWPAFWLLNGYYVGQQPEIDILEVRGENPHQIIHSYHYYENGLQSTSYTTDNGDPDIGYSDGFHTYGVRWQQGRIDWYIDGVAVHTFESEKVAYQVMYVIANLAIGGDFNYSAVDPTLFPVSFDIDYIRVYQEKSID